MNETARAVREAIGQPNPALPQVSGMLPSVRLRGRRHGGPGPRAILAAALVHLVVVLFGWLGVTERREPLPEFTTYRVNLVSPAPPPPAPVVPEAPATPPPPQRIAPPPPQPTPPERQQPPPPPQRQETPPQREPPTATQQREQQETRRVGEALNVNILGDDFPFPAYLENIIRQVQNFFRPPAGGARDLVAEVYFVILPDGSVEDIRVASPSRSMPFNLQAMAAVEQAGNRRAFGPFPDGFEAPRLPVLFSFKPLQ